MNLFIHGAESTGSAALRMVNESFSYFPKAPFGGMSERTAVQPVQCVSLPDELDDVTAAAIANPGMSSWAALKERAHFMPGETVLVNGATGTAGSLAVQIAKYMGAS
ncbi:MAG TPA: hypothetical protein VK604_28315, partial [Bryobacteraceae bacterium]|nr:hypothetical protein [Bryobacteraceae bacterium]